MSEMYNPLTSDQSEHRSILKAHKKKFKKIVNKLNDTAFIGFSLVWGRPVNLQELSHNCSDLHELASLCLDEQEMENLKKELSWNPDSTPVETTYMKYLHHSSSRLFYDDPYLHKPVVADGSSLYIEGREVAHMFPVPHLVWEVLTEDWDVNKIHRLDSSLFNGSFKVVRDYFDEHPDVLSVKDKKYEPTKISTVMDKYAVGPVEFYVVPNGF